MDIPERLSPSEKAFRDAKAFRRFFDSREDGEKFKQEAFLFASRLLTGFINTVPAELVRSTDPNYHKYKCLKRYFQLVYTLLESLLYSALTLNTHLREDISEQMDLIQAQKDLPLYRYTSEDLDRNDFLLRKIIACLRSR